MPGYFLRRKGNGRKLSIKNFIAGGNAFHEMIVTPENNSYEKNINGFSCFAHIADMAKLS